MIESIDVAWKYAYLIVYSVGRFNEISPYQYMESPYENKTVLNYDQESQYLEIGYLY